MWVVTEDSSYPTSATSLMAFLISQRLLLYHPLLYHTKCPNNFVYCYSFSLKPEEHQPTGTCNFSNFDNTTLKLDMSNKTNESNYTIKLFAINYNLLIITEGMGGLAFSC